jgi:hypothetical protein
MDLDIDGKTLATVKRINDSLEISVFDYLNDFWIKRPDSQEFKKNIIASSTSKGENVKLSPDGKYLITMIPINSHNIVSFYRFANNTWLKENEIILENRINPLIQLINDYNVIIFHDQYSPRTTLFRKINGFLQGHEINIDSLSIPFGKIFHKLSNDGKNLYIIVSSEDFSKTHEFINININDLPVLQERFKFTAEEFNSADISGNGSCFVTGDLSLDNEIDKLSLYLEQEQHTFLFHQE